MEETLLAFVGDLYEDLELWYPRLRLAEAGFGMKLAGPRIATYRGRHSYPAASELSIAEVDSHNFSGLLIPGGLMSAELRGDERVLKLTREFMDDLKLVAFISHGGWIPISAQILKGRRVTGSLGIKDDLENAGAVWVDEPVVVDHNLVSSRTPQDLPGFAKAMIDYLMESAAIPTPLRVR